MSDLRQRIAALTLEERAVLERRLKEKTLPAALQPIRRRGDEGPAPLSFAQQRLWILDRLDPGPFYNVARALRIRGPLDVEALGRALAAMEARHEALRSVFPSVRDDPVQVIAPARAQPLSVVDLGGLAEGARETEVRRIAEEQARSPFDLERRPLVRTKLLRLSEQEHVLLVTIHHIVFDGWSGEIFDRELSALYEAYREGRPSPLPELPIQYADFAVWQREWLQGEVLEEQLSYWKRQLDGAPAVLELPGSRPRPSIQSFRGATETVSIPREVAQAIRRLGRREGATLFMTLLAAFKVLLLRHTGQEDIVVGTPVAGRNRSDIEGLIGFFVNTLVLRTDLSGDPTFRELLGRVREVALEGYAHQDLPFEKLVEALNPERTLAHSPIFQVMMLLQNAADDAGLRLAGVSVTPMPLQTETAKFDLTASFAERGEEIRASFEYNTDLFEASTVKRMLSHLGVLLEAIAEDPDRRVSRLSLLTAEERHQVLVEWNRTETPYPREKTVHGLFEEQAERTPEAVAVEFEGGRLTYGELNRRSNQLARHLQALGVGPEVLVGLCVERSLEMVVGLLGILKAGGAYLPLDPAYPLERLRFMVEDAGAPLLLTRDATAASSWRLPARTILFDLSWETIARERCENIESEVTPENLAYVIYTSGSTGKPKGVEIEHGSLTNDTWFATVRFGMRAGERVLQFASLSFDTAAEEIFSALSGGATLVLRTEEMIETIATFLARCREWRLTAVDLPTSYWHELVAVASAEHLELPESLRLVVIGGERALPERFAQWREFASHRVQLLNAYGPTEATVTATFWEPDASLVDPLPRIVPIGRPIANVRVYVLDGRLEPVPVGVVGELYVGGACPARGYRNRPELTAEKFISDPFGGATDRLYRTGDRVRFRDDGELEYLGRVDGQVKLRGFRVEPGEIESALREIQGVSDAVVRAREDVPGQTRLIGYVVADPARPASVGEMRRLLKERLPEYMVPSVFVLLDALPRTRSGKLDAAALPAPEPARPELDNMYCGPRTPAEETLTEIWKNVLRLDRVGVHDNFFELGGHSLLATRVISQARDAFHVELPLRELFLNPTVAGLALVVTQRQAEGAGLAFQEKRPSSSAEPISRRRGKGMAVLSFAQRRLWILHRLDPELSLYNIPRALRIRGRLDEEALGRAVETIRARHEVLRSVFRMDDGDPVQVVEPPRTPLLSVVDLGGLAEGARETEVRRIAEEQARSPFDLERRPLVRTKLLRLSEQEHVLLVTIHHIVFDGWSGEIFDRELSALYEAYREGRPSPLPELPIQYADFAVWQREWLQGEVLEEQLSYWKRQLDGAPAVLELPGSRPRPSIQSFRGATETVSIPREVAQAIRRLGRREGATLFMTLLAAFKVLLLRHTGQEDIVVGTPVAGRNRSDIEGLIGFFVNTLVLRTDLSGDPTFRELLGRVREVALEGYAHQDLPFEKLVEALNPERTLAHSPIFQVMMLLQNAADDAGLRLAGVSVTPMPLQTETAKFDLTASFAERGEEIRASFEYNTDLFEASTVKRMLSHLGVLLEAIAEDPDRRVSRLPLLTAEERHQVLVEWNRTETPYPREKTVHGLFEEQAERTPEAVAVEFEGGRLTYGELNRRSNQLARHLQALGVGPEVLVGLCVERSLEMVVGLLGILKAGGAYLPLDPAYPLERLRFMVEDAGAPFVLTQERLENSLPEGTPRVRLDADWAEIARESGENPHPQTTALDLAYVIYTSGSTGTPKGVSVRHRSVVRLVRETDYLALGPQGVFLQLAPISFDASTFELWGALLNGARLAVMPPGVPSLEDLGAAVKHYEVSTLWLTAGLFHQMVETQIESLRGIRQLLAGGDVLSVPHVEKLLRELPDCRLINGYGPTENTTFTCCHAVRRDEPLRSSVPIGRPIANTRVYILDRHRQPVPVGVPGELYVGGDGLARDYFQRPELTAERFVSDPFGADPETRLYRTGDRVRYLPDGNIEFLGRMDDQMKVRGFRVEPGEIESVLRRHPSVREALVMRREDRPGDARLVGYLVAGPGQSESVSELRAFLKRALPDFMIPSSFVWVESFPLTPNGKVDRAALPPPGHQRPPLERKSVAPRNALESKLARIWERVLDVRPVGVTDNFFELGGHSLLAARLFSEIERDLGRKLALSAIFQAQTIAELGQMLEGRESRRRSPSLVAIQPKGTRPPFFCVHAIWGNVFHYRELARRLGPDQPFYGLQAQGLDGKCSPCETVEEMAARYIEEIREFQSEGPYSLGGHSFGGLVAFEMARQLHSRGQRVDLLALFDTSRSPLTPGPTRLEHVRGRTRFHLASLNGIPPKQKIRYLLGRAQTLVRLFGLALSRAYGRIFHPLHGARRRVHDANRRAARKYVPGFYAGRVTILWAAERWKRLSADRAVRDPQLGWGKLCGEGVEVHEVPGDHASMLEDEANIQVVAERLSGCLRHAREGELRRSGSGEPVASSVGAR